MSLSSNLGFPRVGLNRELKKAVEAFWKGGITAEALEAEAKAIRQRHWQLQKDAGIDIIPSNDFSLYDHVLDTIAMVGAIPPRYKFADEQVGLTTYFAMARGAQTVDESKIDGEKLDVPAMEMTKWLDTNYHFIVPEFDASTTFRYASKKAVNDYLEAKALGIETRPVLVGPLTFLQFGKARTASGEEIKTLSFLQPLLKVYSEVIADLVKAGATKIQIDEPIFALDQTEDVLAAAQEAYSTLAQAAGTAQIHLATYFEALKENASTVFALPVAVVHVDLVRAPQQLQEILPIFPQDKILSVGAVDGRNIWKTNLAAALAVVKTAVSALGAERVIVGPSCSLLHSPIDLSAETALDNEIKDWLSFATQKLSEISALARAITQGEDSIRDVLDANAASIERRRTSSRIHNADVKARAAAVTDADCQRKSDFKERLAVQTKVLNLPLFPTTTIGSFPQTAEVRAQRSKHKKNLITDEEYNAFLRAETERCIRIQEEIGIDVLVHGEFERNDMVEYFGEKLAGFCFTKNGWVQSYGSRCVKPPIIFGDVSRPVPMTVEWSAYAQSLTKNVMKGMLTGPVCILQWSFVRDDQPRSETCKQIALAMRDEVIDLEKAGIKVIQIDEAAYREGLPLRKANWQHYLDWAAQCFHLTSAGVEDDTQIHTHMCYSQFNDIISGVAEMRADVISIETSRSQMELLDAFVDFKYPYAIGPGIYDIHSPRVPSKEEVRDLLEKALKVLQPWQIWVNPDCGLKTRGWPEVVSALKVMVDVAGELRAEVSAGQQ